MPVPTLLQRIEAAQIRLKAIAGALWRASAPLPTLTYRPLRSPGFRQPPIAYPDEDAGWTPLAPGSLWGGWQTHFALRGSFRIPEAWDVPPAPGTALGLHLPLGEARDFEHPEALVYVDGRPLAAVDLHHPLIILPEALCDRADHALLLTGWTGLGGSEPAVLRLGQPALVVLDREVEAFLRLGRAALNAIGALDDVNPAKWDLLAALERGLGALDLRHPIENRPGAPFRESVAAGLAAFRAGLAAGVPPHPLTVHSVGHAHIDTAWLWTTTETRGKVERTFHTALHLLDQHPEYIFAQSQPQLYDWFRTAHPESFARIQEHVRAGRWEPVGGMWIEADCNITGAESLIRQFMLGRAFFDEHFGPGTMTPSLWLPDAFGFPASLPQIAAQAGMQGFFTIKLRWNEVNYFPYDSFWWRGIDGTRLLAHMSTIPYRGVVEEGATYNADPSPSSALYGWARQIDKHHRDVLMSYGWGDGGGGPTREMITMIAALADFPGVPRHRFSTIRAFYDHLRARYGADLPTWDGELYLETHQGTLTSQTRIKLWNHRAETLLHDVEFAATCASLLDTAYRYPHAELREAWRTVCLHQFHDILPGSSIGPVYEDAEDVFAPLLTRLAALREAALIAVAGQFSGGRIVVNPVDAQRVEPAPLAPLTIAPQREPAPAADGIVQPDRLESPWLRVQLDAAGAIVSIYDKAAQRELLPAGARANRLIAYLDRPARYDAWNIDPPALLPVLAEASAAEAIRVVTLDDGTSALHMTRRILNSTIRETIRLGEGGAALEFDLVIDWQDANAVLKAHFPLDVRARTARYGIQWGYVERPTHTNTAWDAARYEVAHHGWIDIGEAAYGVSLIDAGIYGASVRDTDLALTLVKRTRFPDPDGDTGERRLRYALRPHRDGETVGAARAALAFAHPVLSAHAANGIGGRNAAWSPLTIAPSGAAIVQTIKRSEDDRAVIVRLYEPAGTRQTAALAFGFPVRTVERADLYETPLEALPVTDGSVALTLRPFEIVTLRVTPAR
ncbi:MAG: alpha-mannosidase [Candidatus Flexifilum sp.]